MEGFENEVYEDSKQSKQRGKASMIHKGVSKHAQSTTRIYSIPQHRKQKAMKEALKSTCQFVSFLPFPRLLAHSLDMNYHTSIQAYVYHLTIFISS